MGKLIVFDMDGIIFEHTNFWLELHKVYGTYNEGIELTNRYLKTNYQKLVDEVVGRLWKGKDIDKYLKLIKNVKYKEGVKETIKMLKRRGYKTAIISSGPKELAERAMKEVGIDYIYANQLVFENGKVKGTTDIKHWPIRYGNKGESLRILCTKHKIDLKDVIVVCNENNDIKMARSAGLAIALNPTEDEIKRYCNVIIENGTLKDILKVIDKFEQRKSVFEYLQ